MATVALVIGIMDNLADKHTPRTSTTRNNYAPWLDNELKSLVAEQETEIVHLPATLTANCGTLIHSGKRTLSTNSYSYWVLSDLGCSKLFIIELCFY